MLDWNEVINQTVEGIKSAGVRVVKLELELEIDDLRHTHALFEQGNRGVDDTDDSATLALATNQRGDTAPSPLLATAPLAGVPLFAASPITLQDPTLRARARWNPSPNHSSRVGYRPEAIVVHIAQGRFDAIGNWFRKVESRVSAHYGIGQQGQLDQYVAESEMAWHAGNIDRPSWGLLKAGANPNWYTIGIEHAGFADDPWTDAMYDTSARLIKDICMRWQIPLDRNHIIGHRQIDGGRGCPGSQVDLDKLIRMAGGSQESDMGNAGEQHHVVQAGDTLFGIANRYGMTLTVLAQLNPQIEDINLIEVGERIRVR